MVVVVVVEWGRKCVVMNPSDIRLIRGSLVGSCWFARSARVRTGAVSYLSFSTTRCARAARAARTRRASPPPARARVRRNAHARFARFTATPTVLPSLGSAHVSLLLLLPRLHVRAPARATYARSMRSYALTHATNHHLPYLSASALLSRAPRFTAYLYAAYATSLCARAAAAFVPLPAALRAPRARCYCCGALPLRRLPRTFTVHCA